MNWLNEFKKWLNSRLVFAIEKENKVTDFLKVQTSFPILIISYEMFNKNSDILSNIKFDLLICDEGHRKLNLNLILSYKL